ncbi:MAG: M56 family metallopeptidase [Microcella pacifica]|uniref:M56 family metallopeptidase n=1 Tax=Microcella pacifica TaxID=2591847 RepID=A0A9E5JME3_9MICO|nr:M56 family metallopeptidase [Microcella pacifica]NHF63254.1 M56 family metallopeptidase [Microcella pacifica]
MTLALVGALTSAAFTLLVVSPRVLRQARWQVRRPALALALWHVALVLGMMLMGGAMVLSVGAAVSVSTRSAEPWGEQVAISLLGWITAIAFSGLVTVISVALERVLGAQRHNRSTLLSLPHHAEQVGGTLVLECETDEPIACAIPVSGGIVVISTGLKALLNPAQVGAVIAHESAHLRWGHLLATRLADLHLACLPRAEVARQLHRTTRLSIELIADDDAARHAGAVNLSNALIRLGVYQNDDTLTLRAERIAARYGNRGRRTLAVRCASMTR